MELNIRVLGSSSSGNCTLVWDKDGALMIDCGFNPGYIMANLELLDMELSFISGVVITHTHGDHVNRTMMKELNKADIPVYCHYNIRRDLAQKYVSMGRGHKPGLLKVFTDEELQIGNFRVTAFEVPHDSTGGCFGYNILKDLGAGVKKITVATDIGYFHDEIISRFLDSDIIIVESNHDPDMLENSGRPEYLKERIRQIGHLSNPQCAELLDRVIKGSTRLPEAVILAHISQQCNLPGLALDSAREVLNNNGLTATKVCLSHRNRANEILRIKPGSQPFQQLSLF
ncbi:MAG: MBL fold metallo-hydrolase [Ignavibacteria bacterium]|jgi:phosphoribosyl 1,2-cyclic phosphodiesterase|nr:MBL fold metallo-hydrolase [Ignavibacteria bacterium]MCU7502302.1 MBL fold metallo-hydrolase [Ignavibacteria bacterium]MCU7516654.1 MBL fold metallo-hydrolase [Ignavibacteria bacterium]